MSRRGEIAEKVSRGEELELDVYVTRLRHDAATGEVVYDAQTHEPIRDPINLTLSGTTVYFTLRRTRDEPDGSAPLRLSVGSGVLTGVGGGSPTNMARVRVTPAQTSALGKRTYYADVWVHEPDGTDTKVAKGTVTVT